MELCIGNSLQEGTGSVRFVSVPDFSKSHRFGSVRNIDFPCSTRFGLPARFGLVRFHISGSSI